MNYIDALLSHDDRRPMLKEAAGRWHTYGEVLRRAERHAGYLRDIGIQEGSTVAIQNERCIELVEWHLACLAMGAKRVPIHPKKTAHEANKLVTATQPDLILTCNPRDFPGTTTVLSSLGISSPVANCWPENQYASWLFTSGSTGEPKGVLCPLDELAQNLTDFHQRLQITPDMVRWSLLSTDHRHGLDFLIFGAFLQGAGVCITPYSPTMLPPEECSLLYAVPPMYMDFLAHGMRTHPQAFGRLRMVSGSGYLPPAVAKDVREVTGTEVNNRLASTEENVYACHVYGQAQNDTVGVAMPGIEIKFASDGEILVRGGSFDGYCPPIFGDFFDNDGFFFTGDLGRQDDSGQIHFIGRKKEVINRGGELISPDEVEQVFRDLRGVKFVGCFGVDDERLEEVVGIALVLDEGYTRDNVLGRFDMIKGQKLSKTKWPVVVEVIPEEEMPLTSTFKIKRGQLKARFGKK